MKLIYTVSSGAVRAGQEVQPGDRPETFRGEPCQVLEVRPPVHSGSTGRVSIKVGRAVGEFYPAVIGAQWIGRDDK